MSTTVGAVLAVVVVVVAVLGVAGLRAVQGSPPAASWAELTGRSSVAADGGPVVVDVVAGDTWEGIAAQVAPASDPVEMARLFVAANGDGHLEPGQRLVIDPAVIALADPSPAPAP